MLMKNQRIEVNKKYHIFYSTPATCILIEKIVGCGGLRRRKKKNQQYKRPKKKGEKPIN